jgi:hypothetical protein
MEIRVSQPRWRLRITEVVERCDLAETGVLVTTQNPLIAHGQSVVHEPSFMALPHLYSGMVAPALGLGIGERVENLQHLYTLLAKALTIQRHG